MAMSKPYPTSQVCIVMKCELCNTDVDVNWFCKSCIKNLCDNCKRMHEKIPSLFDHDIATIGESRKCNRDVIRHCSEHGEILQYRCKPCFKDICKKCLNLHLKHELVDLNEEGENARREFRTFLEAKKKQLMKLDQEMVAIDRHIKDYQAISQKSIAQITTKYNEVTRLKESLLQRLDNEQKEAQKRMNDQQKVHKDAISTLRMRIEVSEGGVDGHDNISLVHFIRKETAEINAVKIPNQVSFPQPLFISQTANIDINQIFGTLKITDNLKSSTEMTRDMHIKRKLRSSLSKVSSFRHNTGVIDVLLRLSSWINDIVCADNGKAWITGSSKLLQLVDHTGKVHRSIPFTPDAVYLALSSYGDVMVSSCKATPVETKIKKMSTDGRISVFTEMKSCKYVDALTFDSEDNLLCLTEDKYEICMLTKLDSMGKEIWKTSTGNRSFYTSTVCLSHDGNYHVMMGSYICVVRADGKVIGMKKFNDQLGRIGPILYDNCGYLIVGTMQGKIHILDEEMEVLQTFSFKTKSDIYAMAVDKENHLWIGREDGKVVVAKYLE